ncbi:MAG: response regulator [Candidatus Riflebacteria bacterium]|nr:response regulator [Candidatus Riflebacteria bacterium]
MVEDDAAFAQALVDLARDRRFKTIVTASAARVLPLAKRYRPSAITLDLKLPDHDGWTVLDRLKHDPATSHIPVHIISVVADAKKGKKLGAISSLAKPVSREALEEALARMASFAERTVKRLLLVEDDAAQRQTVVDLIGNGDVEIVQASTGAEALAALRTREIDCMVLDLKLPDLSGFEVIRRVQADPALAELPIVIYTGRELTKSEETELRSVAEAIVLKDARSPERLVAETALFLHRVEGSLGPARRRMLDQGRQQDPTLAGRVVFVVDDDLRNIFALTAVLERQGAKVLYAENGRSALAMLQSTPEIEIVLMDIMMPEMDGFETMRAIRAIDRFKRLPIIALTAKAMKGDRERCIEAGASDYITKPVDTQQLLSLLRVWLHR